MKTKALYAVMIVIIVSSVIIPASVFGGTNDEIYFDCINRNPLATIQGQTITIGIGTATVVIGDFVNGTATIVTIDSGDGDTGCYIDEDGNPQMCIGGVVIEVSQ